MVRFIYLCLGETGLIVMFGRAERFSDSHGALCLLGSFAGPYAIIYSTFTFNRLIRAGIKVWL